MEVINLHCLRQSCILSPFELHLYFNAITSSDDWIRRKLVSSPPTYNSGMCMTYAFQLLMMKWDAHTRAALLESVQNAGVLALQYPEIHV